MTRAEFIRQLVSEVASGHVKVYVPRVKVYVPREK